MKIEIEFETLVKNNLSPTEYSFLWMIYYNNYTFVELLHDLDEQRLVSKGFIFIDGANTYALRSSGLDLFEVSNPEQKWAEFKSNYPIKQGDRRLHDQQEKCRQKYLTIIKKPGIHEKIIQGLNNELDARKRAGLKNSFFPEQKIMSSWLNQKHWLTYLEKIKEDAHINRTAGV